MALFSTVSVRFDQERAQKLKRLAERTGRSKGAVVRLLLDQAVLADSPDVRLAGPVVGGHQDQGGGSRRGGAV